MLQTNTPDRKHQKRSSEGADVSVIESDGEGQSEEPYSRHVMILQTGFVTKATKSEGQLMPKPNTSTNAISHQILFH